MIIDNEFKKLIPPITSDELALLEKNIQEQGCLSPLLVWDDTLIDGHHRYDICKKHGILYKVEQLEIGSRDEAKVFIIKNQLGRRNLIPFQRAELVLTWKGVIAGQQKRGRPSKTDEANEKGVNVDTIKTRTALANRADMSEGSLHKVEKILEQAPEDIKAKCRTGDLTIHEAYTQLQMPHVAQNSGDNEWYTPPPFIEAARQTMGGIDLDPASSDIANETVKATVYYTKEQDGLTKDWKGRTFMNPPYASNLIGPHVEKFVSHVKAGDIPAGIVLVNNATETKWWASLSHVCKTACFTKGRVKFLSPSGEPGKPLQAQVVMYAGPNTKGFAEQFKQLGSIWHQN